MKKLNQRLERLNLDGSSILSRQQLKSIAGGNVWCPDIDFYCPDGYSCTGDINDPCVEGGGGGTYTCNATAKPGYTVISPGACSGSLTACQTACDNWCNSAAGCASCTCS